MNKDDFNSKIQDLGDKLGDIVKVATEKTTEIAKVAAQKSQDTIAVAKLNLKISEEKGYIRQKYEKIGKIIYDKYGSDLEFAPDDIRDLLAEITVGFETIELYKNKIKDIKSDVMKEEEYAESFEFEDNEISPDDIEEDICNIISPEEADDLIKKSDSEAEKPIE